MTRSFHKVYFTAQEVLNLVEEAENLEDLECVFLDIAEERSRQPETRLVEMSPTLASFLLNCVSFSRDAGVLRAVPLGLHMAVTAATTLAPIANRPFIKSQEKKAE